MTFLRPALTSASLFVLLAAAPHIPARTPLLDGNAVPISYDVTIAPDMTGIFYGHGGHADGEEVIVVRVTRPTYEITLNAASLRVLDATIDGKTAPIISYPIAQQVAFRTAQTIAPGIHRLHLRFHSVIFSDVHGLWPDSTDPKAPNLVTNFEPATARTLFPCFDEPKFRASFTMHAIAPADWTIISNMPVAAHHVLTENRARTDFQPTPPMPTFLLMLDMGKFASVSSRVGNTPVTVYIRPGKEELAQQILTTATSAMRFFERDLATPYPLPKLDIVVASGVLNDAEQGYGAITIYTEFEVSGWQHSGGLRGEQDAFQAVAGPIALQWFGGLVSPSWWSEAWVMYGLGTYEERRAELALHPTFAAIPTEIDWSWLGAYDKHSGTSVRRKIADDRDPAAWAGLNSRTYDVGPAMLSMWGSNVGENAMHSAMQNYLRVHRDHAVTSDAFWKHFASLEAGGYARAWLDNFGTPVLRATLACRSGAQRIDLEQQPIRSAYSEADPRSVWPIPVRLRIGRHITPVLLTTRRMEVHAGTCGTDVGINEGLRPPYLTAAQHFDSGTSETDRLRVFTDTQFLYDAHLATVNDLIAAFEIYSPPAGGLFRLRYGIRDMIDDAKLLRGSPQEARFDRLVRAWAVPLESRSRNLPPNAPDLNSRGTLLELLSWAPDKQLEASAETAFAASLNTASFSQVYWGNATLAAQGATPADVARLLPVPKPNPLVAAYDASPYLFAVSDDDNVASVLESASSLPNYALYVTELGARNPRFVSHYLETHARAVVASVPPTQQAWTLTSSVVNGCWSARSPDSWRAFFNRNLSQRERTIIDRAVTQVQVKWHQRRVLETQLSHGR